MAVPTFDELFKPVLEASSDGAVLRNKDIRERIVKASDFSEEDLSETLPSGQKRLDNRIGWAKTYLYKAGLLQKVSRDHYSITEEGRRLLGLDVPITSAYLYDNYEGVREFLDNRRPSEKQGVAPKIDYGEGTPEEKLDEAVNEIENKLIDDVLSEVKAQDASFFEGLVVDLLKHIYGGDFEKNAEVTGKSGDGGIDGIVKQDRLGFNSIYIQAKKWADDAVVGRPEVQKFAGALQGIGAVSGAFITTSSFSMQAEDFAKNLKSSTHIVLIDGQRLAKLMIEYDVGVSVKRSIAIKRVDLDYFHANDI